ncbi:TolC family protein [Burkholderia singularis]|uniref:Protein CyaE n=1 Tax=Burkholderia singularis TaxID=1503053 RepID=A0A238H3W4_9BURK|nr:TolC family protein [Burkholderia singularis]SMG00006.1 Type I secretion system, outer membrane component LapE [Burkholderia singularis]
MRLPEAPTLSFVAAVVAAAAGLAGCATSSIDLAPQAADRPWLPQTTPAGQIVPAPQKAVPDTGRHDYTLPANHALGSVAPAGEFDPARIYTLPDLIDLAESANPLTRIAWNDARNAALAVGIAKSAYLPQLSVAAMGRYLSGHSSSSTELGDSGVDATSRSAVSALSLQWLLFDFGGRAARVEAAKQGSIVANIAFTGLHQQVIHDVTVAYYRYQAAHARVRTARQALDNADAIVAAARARFKQGTGTVVEVAQATQNRAQANLAFVEAQGADSDAYLSVVSALGISPLSKPTLAELPVQPLSPALRTSVDEIVASAIARRPDVLSAYAAEKASDAKIRAAQAEFMPKVFMSASASYNASRSAITALPAIGQQAPTVNLNGSRYGGSVFVGVSIPLYDGGLRSAVLMQARNDAQSAQARLERTKEEAVRQIVAAQNALQTSLASHEAAKALVDAARTSYDAALTAYRNGVGSITDATLAQSQLLVATNAYVDSYSGALSAAAALALATGTISAAQ